MIRTILLFLCTFSLQVSANPDCDEVVPSTKSSDVMYVVCKDLSEVTETKANQILKRVFEQYTGEPDEILVYFVPSLNFVGLPDSDISPNDLVGVYYTHDSILRVWPKIESRKKEIHLKWW